jgi:glutamyl-tRNA reductase
MGEIAVRALVRRGLSKVTVINRTFRHAEQLAQAWGGKAMTFQQLPEALAGADIVITSTGAPHTILDKALVEPAMLRRPERPLFVIDIAVPRNVDPDVATLSNVYLHDIDDLQSQAEDNVRERALEIPRVEVIVEEEISQFLEWFSSLDAVATITDLRSQIEQLRQVELERLFNKVDLDDRERELVATMSHRLVNKILHQPIMRLKQEAAQGNGAAYTSVVRHLFWLDGGANKEINNSSY